ncbi:hypothetical protein CEE75_13440, partial [Lactobacillus crispatus]
ARLDPRPDPERDRRRGGPRLGRQDQAAGARDATALRAAGHSQGGGRQRRAAPPRGERGGPRLRRGHRLRPLPDRHLRRGPAVPQASDPHVGD